jgi:hypothetical protein
MNHKRFRRLYREEKLQVRQRGARKRAVGVRAPLSLPNGPPIAEATPPVRQCSNAQPHIGLAGTAAAVAH